LKDKDKMPSPEMIANIVSDMDLSGQHLLDLINDLLDISKIEAGQMDLYLEQVNAGLLMDEIVRKFQNQIQQSQLELVMNVADMQISVDTKRLKQILINLIGNALKFTDAGKIIIQAYMKDNMAVFEVRDTGAGISEKDLPHIFEAFIQADSSSTRVAGGSGLGLAITKKLVELHGGEITAESTPGTGSIFKFTIKQ
jgi:signal transduction histidine kinase